MDQRLSGTISKKEYDIVVSIEHQFQCTSWLEALRKAIKIAHLVVSNMSEDNKVTINDKEFQIL